MSRIVIIDYHSRPRPRLATPAKGSVGDMTNESMLPLTDLGAILKRYGGNLAELAAWRGAVSYGDSTIIPNDLQEAFDKLKDAHEAFENLPDNPFASFEDAMTAIENGTIADILSRKNAPEDTPSSPDVSPDPVKPNKPTKKEPKNEAL